MCFSIKISKDIEKLTKHFNAEFSAKDSVDLQNLFTLQAKMDQSKFESDLGIPHSKGRSTPFRMPSDDGRVFPGYFANVIISEAGKRVIKPMRYRLRPNGSNEEIPDKFGVYNARIDSLTTKKTWQPLFMRKHGLIAFSSFYEWVLDPDEKNDLGLFNFLDENEKQELGENKNARKRLITFSPQDQQMLCAPCLWDEWISSSGEISFKSFAIITDDPPKEVEIMGHDRCPIFLNRYLYDEWLNPKNKNKNEVLQMLNDKEKISLTYEWFN